MTAEAPLSRTRFKTIVRWVRVSGPGLLVMLADTDAGNVVTAAQAGAQWRYRLLILVLLLIPALYMVQELTVRLGIYTGYGHAELIRKRLGIGWASLAMVTLSAATIGSLVTEFVGVAGVGELFGLSRSFTLPAAVALLLLVVATGLYRRVERTALIIAAFELAFFAVAWAAHPSFATLVGDEARLPLGNHEFIYLAAAIIGATFNPWMVFGQQSAIADKKIAPGDLAVARWDTAIGAVLTQCLTGAVLIATAASLASGDHSQTLTSIGEISQTLAAVLGYGVGRMVFCLGVVGASLVAAIVSSLALAWGVGEVTGHHHSLEYRPFEAAWFYGAYAAAIVGAAGLVWWVPNLVQLIVAAQVINVFLLPIVLSILVVLAAKALPEPACLKGPYLAAMIGLSTIVSAVGIAAGSWGLL
jgi:Mn2+/Fe2+ NRAMP family transporter